jgi:hypothetical protein
MTAWYAARLTIARKGACAASCGCTVSTSRGETRTGRQRLSRSRGVFAQVQESDQNFSDAGAAEVQFAATRQDWQSFGVAKVRVFTIPDEEAFAMIDRGNQPAERMANARYLE